MLSHFREEKKNREDEAAAKQKEAKSRWRTGEGEWGVRGGRAYADKKEEARWKSEVEPLSANWLYVGGRKEERLRGTAASMKQSLFFILHICT